MAGGNDRIPVFPWPSMISSELVGPNDGGGISKSQADPAGGVSDILQAGPSTGTPVPPEGAAQTAAAPAAQHQVNLREQDRHLPISNVFRIMRRVLPMHAKTSDDAKYMIQECVSEYISFITSEANERCKREHRKTITAEDVIWAMGRLGFDHYVAPLSLYLQRYRENQGDLLSGLHGEHFPIIKHRHRPPITDTVSAPVHHAQPLQIRSSMPPLLPLPPPPSSSLDVPPSAPPPPINHLFEQGYEDGYFRRTYGGGNGAGTSNSEAPPMPDFFP